MTLQARTASAGGDAVVVDAQCGDASRRLRFRASPRPAGPTADTALALTLPVAMRLGVPLQVGEGPSLRLLAAVPTLQAIFSTWSDDLEPVPVETIGRQPNRDRARGVACFFSGGVDSFYTVLQRRAELTHLIFVHGFDLPPEATELREQASQTARAVADSFGLGLVEVETDLRNLLDRHVPWGLAHGSALASVGLLFQEMFQTVLVPATHTYADLLPWGSHPLTDPLWSTEQTEFVHYGADATRVEKCRVLARSETAMAHLRVCWENRRGRYNCGECEKCLRTMVNLSAVGALERCATLPHSIDPSAVAAMTLLGANDQAFVRENLQALEAADADPALRAALRECLARHGADDGGVMLREMREHLENCQRVLADLESSTSWRLTRPLRVVKGLTTRHSHLKRP